MERRVVLGMIGSMSFLGAVNAGRAQTPSDIRRIGFLAPGEPGDMASVDYRIVGEQAREPFRKLGWFEGKNITTEARAANNSAELLQKYAEELVRLRVEVIVTLGTAATRAAMQATSTIPIVFQTASDPARTGLVSSLARPGGNVTGFAIVDDELRAKRAALLRELLPNLRTVGVLVNALPGVPQSQEERGADERLYKSLGFRPLFFDIAAEADAENAVALAARQGAGAVVVPGVYYRDPAKVAGAAIRNRLPSIGEDPQLVEAGLLLSLAPDAGEKFETQAYFVDRILRGAKPADLPVRQPARFELCINMISARSLGIVVPQSLLLRATRVVQ